MEKLTTHEDITKVELSVLLAEDAIYATYKGLHVIVTNLKMTEPDEPEGWVSGIVRYYSRNYSAMNKLMMEIISLDEFEDSILIFIPDNNAGSLGAMVV